MSIATQNGGRCSSLPPSTFNNENCLAVLDLSAESMVTSRIPSSILQHSSKERHKNSNLEPSDVAQGPTYFSSCNVFQSYPTSEDSQVHQSTRISPSGSSLVTDEDSGYGRIAHPAFGQTGSSSSIANSGLSAADNNSISDSAPRDELLIVMTEDLVDWFQRMYPGLSENFDVDNFFEKLSDGVLLCHYANDLHHLLTGHCSKTRKEGRLQLNGTRIGGVQAYLPAGCPVYQTRGLQGSSATCGFVSRDNVSNFLTWCRQLGMLDSVLFESEDLVCRKNPRNVAICLLELARLGGRFGMAIPELIQLEVEIDEELATESHDSRSLTQRSSEISSSSSSITEHDRILYCRRASCGVDKHVAESKLREPMLGSRFCCSTGEEERGDGPRDRAYKTNRSSELRKLKKQQDYSVRKHTSNVKEAVVSGKRKPELNRPVVDMRSLDEIVRDLLSQCTCPQTFPMIRVSEGRYLFGDKCTQIFVRILRNHVMVRVGGGWDTLNHFLTKYDECRKANPPNYRVPSESVFPSKMRQAKVNPSDADQVLTSIQPCNTTPPSKEGSPIKGQGILCAIKKSPSRELPNDQLCYDLESHKKYHVDTVIPVGKAASTESYQNETCNFDQPEVYSTLNLTPADTSESKVFPELVSTQQTTADNVSNNIFNGLCKSLCTATEQLGMTQLPSSDSRNEANDMERNSNITLMKSTSRKTSWNNVFDRLSNSTPRKSSLGQLLDQDGPKASRSTAAFKASKPKQSRSTKPMLLSRVDRKLQQQQCVKAESTEGARRTKPPSSGQGSRFQDASTPLFIDVDPPHKIGAKHRLSSCGMNEQIVNSRRPSAPQSSTSPVSPVGLSALDCSDGRFSRIPRPIRSYSLSRIPLSTTSIARLNLTSVHDI
ncbi:hypothetical protein CRM22_005873 [Opisthorchis felineus]|uniref:GAR domain-containing protein n=1 Tax=Opisthorchis felineus TaxID=147828 RepID=A0A4V3SEQ6_OPIFE|nr:hypothetical protein CRM22_005873 [Opisthorchis felineus]